MTEENKDNAQADAPMFRMQKMYVKDLSFENPNAPAIYGYKDQEPQMDVNLQLNRKKLDDDHWEVAMQITAKVADKNNDDKVLFVLELEHAAVFLLKGIPEEHMDMILAVDCPTLLFPFTRQIASQVSVDGGFIPFLMEPINFMALFQNSKQQEQDKEQKAN